MKLNDIVEVNVTAEEAAVSQAGFGTALIIGGNVASVLGAGVYIKTYTDPADMLTDGFLSTDYEYLMAVQLMGQAKKPQNFKLGVHGTPAPEVMELTYTGTLTAGSVSLEINRTTYTQAFDTDEDTTMAALAVLIAADADINTCTWDSGNNKLVLTSISGRSISYKSLAYGDFTAIARAYVAQTTTIAEDLTNIDNQDTDWYALLLATDARDDVIAAATQVNTRKKALGFDVYDVSVVDGTDSDDIGSYFKTSALGRAIWIYKIVRDKFYMASWFGRMLPETPGAANWAYKTLSGVAAIDLTSSEQTAIDGKYGNMYEVIGGVNVPYSGRLPDGSWIDILRGKDWLSARTQEAVYAVLVASPKVPYNPAGWVKFENAIFAVLKQGITNGLLVDDDFLSITIPELDEISAADKANRYLPDVKFQAHLQGATNRVKIDGTVSLP